MSESEETIRRRLRGDFTREELKDSVEFPLKIEGRADMLKAGVTAMGSGELHSHMITIRVQAQPQQPHGISLADNERIINLDRFKSIDELKTFVEQEFHTKQAGEKEILLYDAVEIVQKFHDGTLNLPLSMGPERWTNEAGQMASAEIETHVANNQALLSKFKSFEDDLKKQTTELTDSRRLGEIIEDGLTQATADAKVQAEYLEERAKDIGTVKNATPVLQQVVQTLEAALERRRSERPSEAEVEKVKKTLLAMQNQAKDISVKLDALREKLTYIEANVKPGHAKVEEKMRSLLADYKRIEKEFRKLRFSNKAIEEIQDWSLHHPHNIPLRFQHASSPWSKGIQHP